MDLSSFAFSKKRTCPTERLSKIKAAIYFDYNDPILTNTTRHTIGRPILTSQSEIADPGFTRVRSWPNPASESLHIVIDGAESSQLRKLELYDANGRLQQVHSFRGNQLQLSVGRLPAGLYYYNLREGQLLMNRGKVVLVK